MTLKQSLISEENKAIVNNKCAIAQLQECSGEKCCNTEGMVKKCDLITHCNLTLGFLFIVVEVFPLMRCPCQKS